ncbi:Chloroplast protein FOR GROWTH AND FERTILITY 2 [Linum perenne]
MERLLYSSSPTSSLHCKPTLPRLPRITAAKLGGFPFLPRQPELRRFSYVSCKYESNPPPKSSVSRALQVDSSSGSVESSDLAEQIPAEASRLQRKVVNVAACVLLSAIFMFTMHPIFASPALATFQTAANTGTKLIRTELLSSAWTGFFAGCLHTLSGPDHLAALAPLSIGRSRLESAAVGALWGCGHDAGQVIFGLLFLLLKDRLHIEILRTWGTRVVGITLLVIGGMGIKEASEVPTPCVALENGECDAVVGKKKKIGFATFATGIVHGLQPDALMMVLPALALPSRVAGAAFLVMFLVGTVIAMGCYTVFIGSCSEALKDRVPRITEKLTWASSLIAITLGVAILISQFFGFSLY